VDARHKAGHDGEFVDNPHVNLDCFVATLLAMTSRCDFGFNFQTARTRARLLAARASELCVILCVQKNRGRRESRVHGAPAASCAVKKAHELVTTGSPEHPAFPAQWF